jgi:hypothetical protein
MYTQESGYKETTQSLLKGRTRRGPATTDVEAVGRPARCGQEVIDKEKARKLAEVARISKKQG